MSAMQRRVMARLPLTAADVEDRAMVRNESAAFESSFRAQVVRAAGVREWSQSCGECGETVIFAGTLDDWIDAAITFDDVHLCTGLVAS